MESPLANRDVADGGPPPAEEAVTDAGAAVAAAADGAVAAERLVAADAVGFSSGHRAQDDIAADGGVLKAVLRAGDGDRLVEQLPDEGRAWQVDVAYTGRLLSGQLVDSSENRGAPFRFLLGRGDVIRGWDLAVATMRKGERAEVAIRADYAYGVAGRQPLVPPHATLVFELELLAVEQVDPADRTSQPQAGGSPCLALPAPADAEATGADGVKEEGVQTIEVGGVPVKATGADGVKEEGVQTIEVGGVPVKLDKLGPVVVNTDGSLSRIANWQDMTPGEQKNTLRLIGKRNQQRLAALKGADG